MRCVGPISGMTSSGPILAEDGTPFVNINPAANQEGSAVPSEVFNVLLRELTNLVEFANIVPSANDSDLQQVRKAVQALIASKVGLATTTVAGISLRATPEDIAAKTATDKTVSPADLASITVDKWTARAIGEPFAVWDHLTGAEIPPTAADGPRFIKLSAADAYNDGLLSGESVSGTAPDITATAVIAFADSPLHGQTIHLINTERRFLRGGASGVIEGDAIRNITGTHAGLASYPGEGGAFAPDGSYSGNGQNAQPNYRVRFDASRVVPVAGENRPRNIAATYYLRIK